MSMTTTDDGVELYYETTGTGTAMLFLHEFAGDYRSWEPQVRHFSRTYRCITYAARGFPPSAVPDDPASYSQDRAVSDALCVLDAAGVERAYVVGNSMGGFAALHLALRHPDRLRGAVVAGCGYGAHPDANAEFRAECERLATAYESEGARGVAEWYAFGKARVQYASKDPRGHAEHARILAEHDALGAALTMRGVQQQRPSLYALTSELEQCTVPVLVIAGDEDTGILETDLMLKRTLPRCGLAILPRSGHVTNLEEPELFNSLVQRFVLEVEEGGWGAHERGGSHTLSPSGDHGTVRG